MKIPKIFIPNKDLESKIRELIKESKIKEEIATIKKGKNYQELKKEFPNLTDYLFKLYPELEIIKVLKRPNIMWQFYIRGPFRFPIDVGYIGHYTKECSRDVSEYGYEAQILVKKQWVHLKYKIKQHCFDTKRNIISKDIQQRCDSEDTPFP